MLVGMVAVSVVVSIGAASGLWLAGFGLTQAMLYGYIGGGMASMLMLAALRGLLNATCSGLEMSAAGTARHDTECLKDR